MLMEDIKYKKSIYIRAQSADAAPPLGTILGNIGVNTINFCTAFNIYTKQLPNYFLLGVNIVIFDNRTFSFSVKLPSIGFILSLLKFERTIKVKVNDRLNDKIIVCVKLSSILQLAKLKFGKIDYCSLKVLKGTLYSMNLIVVKD